MQIARTQSLLPLLLSLSAACAADSEYTREQASALSGVTPEGDDICAMEGWYGDGVCDDFCLEHDEDCGGPSCESYEFEIASEAGCAPNLACHAVTLDGITIWCQRMFACGAVVCAEDESQYDFLEQCMATTGDDCREEELCGYPVWCAPTPE